MSNTPTHDVREKLDRVLAAAVGRFDIGMRAAEEAARKQEEQWRRAGAAVEESLAAASAGIRALIEKDNEVYRAVAKAARVQDQQLEAIRGHVRAFEDEISVPAWPFVECQRQMDSVIAGIAAAPSIPELLEAIRDELRAKPGLGGSVADPPGGGLHAAGVVDPLPATWTGRWITHGEAARVIGYTSAQSGVIASGDTMRKAIMAAADGDPLAMLRDSLHRRAKNPRTGRLRLDAVQWVARERGTHEDDAARRAAPVERRKTRSGHALNA
jgi:hypothetical protein